MVHICKWTFVSSCDWRCVPGLVADPGKAHLPPPTPLTPPVLSQWTSPLDQCFWRIKDSCCTGTTCQAYHVGVLIRALQAHNWSLMTLCVCPVVYERSDGVMEREDWLGWHRERSHLTLSFFIGVNSIVICYCYSVTATEVWESDTYYYHI